MHKLSLLESLAAFAFFVVLCFGVIVYFFTPKLGNCFDNAAFSDVILSAGAVEYHFQTSKAETVILKIENEAGRKHKFERFISKSTDGPAGPNEKLIGQKFALCVGQGGGIEVLG